MHRGFAKSPGSNDDAAMRTREEALAIVIGLVAVPPIVLIFHFARTPLQPVYPAMARVVAIAPWDGKVYAGQDHIVVRNRSGTGEFTMREADMRCHVGQWVPVEQQGVSLMRAARTCR